MHVRAKNRFRAPKTKFLLINRKFVIFANFDIFEIILKMYRKFSGTLSAIIRGVKLQVKIPFIFRQRSSFRALELYHSHSVKARNRRGPAFCA